MKRCAANACSVRDIGADYDYARSVPYSAKRHDIFRMANKGEYITPRTINRMRIATIRRNVQHRQFADSESRSLFQNQRDRFISAPNAA